MQKSVTFFLHRRPQGLQCGSIAHAPCIVRAVISWYAEVTQNSAWNECTLASTKRQHRTSWVLPHIYGGNCKDTCQLYAIDRLASIQFMDCELTLQNECVSKTDSEFLTASPLDRDSKLNGLKNSYIILQNSSLWKASIWEAMQLSAEP